MVVQVCPLLRARKLLDTAVLTVHMVTGTLAQSKMKGTALQGARRG